MPLLTQAEVAAILRCHPNTVARLRKAGQLPHIAMRPVKIRSEDLDRWIAQNTLRARKDVRARPVPSPAEQAEVKTQAIINRVRTGARIRSIVRSIRDGGE